MGRFPGNRPSAPLGPPSNRNANMRQDLTSPETLQAVRQRQREKQRHFAVQMMRAQTDRDTAHEAGQTDKASAAETRRQRMSDAADALNQQIMIIERIMEEFGQTLDFDEEARENNGLLEESHKAYERSALEAEQIVRDQMERNQYISTITSPSYINPNDVYSEEDKAMQELDDCVRERAHL